MERTSLDVYFI